MVNKRNVGISIILTIITLGLYGIYWFVSLTNESNHLSDNNETSGIIAFLFVLITCGIYTFFWSYKMGKKIYDAQSKAGLPANDNSILYLILNFIGLQIVTYAIVQSDINQILDGNSIAS